MLETLNQAYFILRDGTAQLIAALPGIIIGLIVFFVFYRASGFVVRRVVRLLPQGKRSQTLSILLGRLVRGVLIGVGVLVAMTIALPTFQPSELIQILGVGGIAVGFAFRDIFENFLAGILLLLDQPFHIGDQIIAGGYEGTVEEIQIRATYIRTYDGRRVVVPNSELYKGSVIVNTAFDQRRSEYDVGIGYESDIIRAQQLMQRVMEGTPGVLKSPKPDTIMMEMGDSAIIIRVRWWTKPFKADVLRAQDAVLRTMKNRLTEEGFNIPFPIRTVMFYDQSIDGVQGEQVNQERINANGH